MELREYISRIIQECLNEGQILKESLDFNNWDSVVSWLEKDGPEIIFDDESNIDWTYRDNMTGDDLETIIINYIEKYNEVSSTSEIDIYRMVLLNNINDLDLRNVGVFWSFEENGVGAYGVGKKMTGNNPFILNATVNTSDIDWEQGFYSFITYGRSEFECYMKKGSKCLITHINEKELDKPINGIC
jgi:hypothetical protein